MHDPAAERLLPLLGRLENFERSRPDRRVWDLATTRALLRMPEPAPLTVQVGGSKGKGTTCAFAAALGARLGRRTGCYLSPHAVTLLERFLVGGRPIEVDALEAPLRAVLQRASALRVQPTFFEALTVAAVDVFAAAGVDLAIYEVGLGGRFDATTAIPAQVSIVTGIELEHTQVLGDTAAAIAAEKAPVIRPGGTGFTAARGEALAVLEQHARDCGARLCVLGTDLHLVDAAWHGGDYTARLVLPGGRELPVRLPDARGFEPQALALAAAALAELLPDATLDLDPAPRPVSLPCRFEVRTAPDGAPLVLDGAHTEHSLAAVAAELRRRWPDRPVSVLFACAADKRWRPGLSALLAIADSFVVTGLSGTAGEEPRVIADWLEAQGARCAVAGDAAAALDLLCARPGPRLVCGSFYLAGAVSALLRERTGA
ncbi:MAG: glutamate ligase domain-containing protein [Planctomycetota bacterium]